MYLKAMIAERLQACKLSLNEEKTKGVFCKNPVNKVDKEHKHVSFDFLGYTFLPKMTPTRNGTMLLTLSTMSKKSKTKVMG